MFFMRKTNSFVLAGAVLTSLVSGCDDKYEPAKINNENSARSPSTYFDSYNGQMILFDHSDPEDGVPDEVVIIRNIYPGMSNQLRSVINGKIPESDWEHWISGRMNAEKFVLKPGNNTRVMNDSKMEVLGFYAKKIGPFKKK